MKTRVITAVVAIGAFIPLLFLLPAVCLQIVLAIFCAVGAYELLGETKIVDKKSPFLYFSCLIAAVVPFLAGSSAYDSRWLYLLVWIYMFGAFLFGVMRKDMVNFSAIAKGMFASLIVPYMFSAVLRIINIPVFGKYLVLLPWVCVWICDSTALFVGKAIGKTKLAPEISPKKTVAGSVGGLIGAIIACAAYVLIVNAVFDLSLDIVPAIIFGAVGSTAGQLGDLAFSLIKRESALKDYGKIFPGHGGVYDRFDSIAFAASFFEIFCLYIYSII
ncbi:MAG: phosphatidate cytidylyltransferase [Clostridia bacterium]|nr:phosphatidate cytidylyltransferase [Clostridia bacterium]